MKLYRVRLEYETVVLAEDERSAEAQAETVIRHEDDVADLVMAQEIKGIDDIPSRWDVSCRPWGERDPLDRTIGEILKP